jgi:hypothetical protein
MNRIWKIVDARRRLADLIQFVDGEGDFGRGAREGFHRTRGRAIGGDSHSVSLLIRCGQAVVRCCKHLRRPLDA